MDIVLVTRHEVVDGGLALLIEALHAVEDDNRQLIGVSRVIGPYGGEGDGVEQAVAVLVLQPFAVERGPPRGPADEEPLSPHVRRGPDQVPHPLKAKH